MNKRFVGRMRTAACLVGLAAVSAMASERIALTDGWKFSREEHPGQMRYLMYDMVADWLDFMGRDLMELPGPCRTTGAWSMRSCPISRTSTHTWT